MNPVLEFKKLKGTALLPGLIAGGILAALLPVIDLAARGHFIIDPSIPPLESLMRSDWMLMAMFNSFLMIVGTCIVYHIEFADNAIQRMDMLPIRLGSVFLSKFFLLAAVFAAVFAIEGGSLYFCIWKWFSPQSNTAADIARLIGGAFVLSLPVLSLTLAVSSFFKNMWITLGIGVVGLFAAMILQYAAGMAYYPFLMPYQLSARGIAANGDVFIAALAETGLFLGAGIVLSQLRRRAA